ncbi:MAG: hypothetical protein JSU87_16780 [Gemmatimonadota bacterium]|nr:MAG: hypothetical protein JSU87_16780 [Gemmatimonadota bacterium]
MLTLCLCQASAAWAQGERTCSLELITTPGTISHMVTLPSGERRVDISRGVEATCGVMWVRADSASWYEGRGILYMFGNVQFRDPSRTLNSERATYYQNEDWVRAEGNVRLTDTAEGSTLTGPQLDYYPQNEFRLVERMYAPQRPHIVFRSGSGEAAGQAFEVDADRVHIYGDSLIAGSGNVVAVRGELNAFGDSLHFDTALEELWLLGDPRVEAQGTNLEGDTVLVLLEAEQVREIHSWPNGSARGDGVGLAAPYLRMFVEEEEVTRTVASAGAAERTGVVDSAGRAPWARSESNEYILVADSIDILRPGGSLQQVIAVQRARANTREMVEPADSLLGTDWLVGDTITGYFTAAEASGAGQDAELERLVASGSARALYHVRDDPAGADPALQEAALNYVIGRIVTLQLEGGAVQGAEVILGTGLYLEPLPAATNGDSTLVVPEVAPNDSSAVPPDTTITLGARS